MSQRELLVDVKDLNRIEISACEKCSTAVLYNVDSEERVPERCPSCGDDFYQSTKTIIDAYRNFFRSATTAGKASFRFRITES